MIFDNQGLPQISGASDRMDSAFAAGMMATFDYTNFDKSLCLKYVLPSGECVRYPSSYPEINANNFSRDQLVALVSGLHSAGLQVVCGMLLDKAKERGWYGQNTESDIPGSTKKWPDGPDWLSYSVRNFLSTAAGRRTCPLGKINLIIDILWAAYVDKEHEVNQLLCMCLMAGPFYVKLLKFLKRDLVKNINDYWSGWRKEQAMGLLMIAKLDSV